MAQLNVVRTYGYSEVVTVDGNASPLLYVAGLNVDADGSPRAYSPDSKSGLGNREIGGEWRRTITSRMGRQLSKDRTIRHRDFTFRRPPCRIRIFRSAARVGM